MPQEIALERIIQFLPQKTYLTFVDGLEKSAALPQILPQLLHVVILTLPLFIDVFFLRFLYAQIGMLS